MYGNKNEILTILFASINGFGWICRPSSSPICSPICSWLLAGPISVPQNHPDDRRGLGFLLDASSKSTDSSDNRRESAQPQRRLTTLPSASNFWQGPYGSYGILASLVTSTSICLAKAIELPTFPLCFCLYSSRFCLLFLSFIRCAY